MRQTLLEKLEQTYCLLAYLVMMLTRAKSETVLEIRSRSHLEESQLMMADYLPRWCAGASHSLHASS